MVSSLYGIWEFRITGKVSLIFQFFTRQLPLLPGSFPWDLPKASVSSDHKSNGENAAGSPFWYPLLLPHGRESAWGTMVFLPSALYRPQYRRKHPSPEILHSRSAVPLPYGLPSSVTSTASFGINLGSTVVIMFAYSA